MEMFCASWALVTPFAKECVTTSLEIQIMVIMVITCMG